MSKIDELFYGITKELDEKAKSETVDSWARQDAHAKNKGQELPTHPGYPEPFDVAHNRAGSLVVRNMDLENLKKLPRTEETASTRLYEVYGNRVSYVEAENVWYVWNGRIHEPVSTDAIAHQMIRALWKSLCGNIDAVETRVNGSEISEDEKAKSLKKWRRHRIYRDRLASAAGKSALIQLMKMDFRVDDDHFLEDRRWFVTQDCVFDLNAVQETLRFVPLPHSPDRPVYRMFDVKYDPQAKHPALNQFLDGSIADSSQATFFGKAVSVALFGAVTPDSSTVVTLQGATRSGKSMINNVVEDICGVGTGFFADPPEDAITHFGKDKLRARYPMRNARYVAFSEVRAKIDHEFILKYAGGDGYAVEQKYITGTSVKPMGIIFVANNCPFDVDKSDPAMFRRLAPINFPNTFSKADPDHYLDTTLRSRIVKESSGFLNWLMGSFIQYLDEGLDRSESMEALLRDEADDDDTLGDYLQDRIDTGLIRQVDGLPALKSVKLSSLHENYILWCRDHGMKQGDMLPSKAFKSSLITKGYRLGKASVMRVVGIEANESALGFPRN